MFDGPIYGPEPQRRLPFQDANAVLLHAERFNRATEAHKTWAEEAKRCVDYFEGRQWSAVDRKMLNDQNRAALTFNKIRPLVNLVNGYMLSNPTEVRYFPGNASGSSAEIGQALTHVGKGISAQNDLPFVDSIVWLDGILTGRGFYAGELSFNDNDFGEIRWSDDDPFSRYLDPEASDYDINKGGYTFGCRWVSIDEIEVTYGRKASDMVKPLFQGGGTVQSTVLGDREVEITPWRTFGGEEDHEGGAYGWWRDQLMSSWIDRSRKTVRLIDIQHYVWVRRWQFVDLETGDRKVIPQHWKPADVEKMQAYAANTGNPVAIVNRPTRLVRWTHMAGDVLVYDKWSPYKTFTLVPFFPYFRRGMTRGMVADLIDPQDEINKRRSARLNIVSRTANGGWQAEKGSLDADQRDNILRFGSTPGVLIEYDTKNGKLNKPEQILPSSPSFAHEKLEQEAEDDLKEISGVNDSALGQLDRVQSGRAIEARQRQTVVGLEGFVANWRHTKRMFGKKQLEMVQQHYTEERVIRIVGEGEQPAEMIVNQRTAEGIVRNLTLGEYVVTVDETPLSKSFLEGQFEELMRMKELQVPIPDEALIDASSVGRKDEIKGLLQAAREHERMLAEAGMNRGPSGGGKSREGGNLPANEPGRPPAMAAE